MAFEVSQSSSLLEEVLTDVSLENNNLSDPSKNPEVPFIKTNTDSESLLETIKQEDIKIETEDNSETKEHLLSESNITSILDELIKDEVLFGYEDAEVKTVEDFKNLINDNINDRLSQVNQNIFEETLAALPPQFQSIMKYGMSGGQDVKSLLDSWGKVEEVYSLDTSTPAGKEAIVREYLTLTNYGTPEMIEQDIKMWADLDKLDDKANLYKPQLEEYHMTKVANAEKQAEEASQYEINYQKEYAQAVSQVLSQETVGGLQLDNQTKNFIYSNSQPVYQSFLTGKPVDALQATIEELKFGQNANPEFYAELLLMATNPDYYKETLKKQLRSELAIEKERTLRKKVQNDISGGSDLKPDTVKIKQDNTKWY